MTAEQTERALKVIEQQYASFINQQNSWDFFRGLAEYTRTLQETVQTKPFIDALERQRELARKTYELMNSEAMKELTKSAKRLTTIAEGVVKQYEPMFKQVQEVAEKYQPVIRAVQEVHDRMAGRILSSNPLSGFDNDLFDVARFVRASGNEEAVKEFENNKKRTQNIYGNYTFSPTYENIGEEERKIERKEQVEAWGAWHQLPLVKRLVFEPEEMTAECKAELEKDRSFQLTWLNFVGVVGEMEKIREGKGSDDDVVFFRVKDFRSYAQRVHTHITTELLKADTNVEKSELVFEEATRILHFTNEKILISKKEESDPHKLIRTLFKDTHKIWANDEILEDWGYSFDEKPSVNKVYQAGKAINRVIAQDTKIKDFIDVSTKSVSINKKYLKT